MDLSASDMNTSRLASSDAGSTPTDDLVRRAAVKALALCQKAQRTGHDVDAAAIRQSAIQSALAEGMEQDLGSTHLVLAEPSADMLKEMQEVRALMKGGTHEGNTASSSENISQASSAGLSGSVSAPANTLRHQASLGCDSSLAERAQVASAQSSDGTGANPDRSSSDDTLPAASTITSSGSSAAERFFQVAELAALLASRLEYDRIDLIVLSQVSKRVRACVLPVLNRSVNVCVTKAGSLVNYLANNPGLIEHVKYLRVWDDVAHYHANFSDPQLHESQLRCPKAPKHTQYGWQKFDVLLQRFERHSTIPPLLELSVGQFDLAQLKIKLESFPRVVAALASLDIVSDYSGARKDALDNGMEPRIFMSHAQLLAEDMTTLFNLICDSQDQAGSHTFRKLSLFALPPPFDWAHAWSGPPVLPPIGNDTLRRIAARIEALSLSMHDMYDSDAEALASILGARWTVLREMNLHVQCLRVDHNLAVINGSVRTFLRQHTQLEHAIIRILEPEPGVYSLSPEWHLETLPHIRSFYLEFDIHSAEEQADFARRHPRIKSLSSREPSTNVAYASESTATEALRRFRGDAGSVLPFLAAGIPLRHVGVDYAQHSPAVLEVAMPSITCCEHVTDLSLTSLPPDSWARHLWLPCMPNLVELTIHLNALTGGVRRFKRGSTAESVSFLRQLFNMLATHNPKLRALAVRSELAATLPSDDVLTESIRRVPPELQYLTWHVPYDNCIQSYRVIRPLSLRSLASHSTGPEDCEYVQAPPRFQRLPSNFRPFVNRSTGVWEDLSDLDTSLTLFDHMGDEPRLKYP
ncbi:hypothetical protein OC835_003429 [Tilletia horrida]|uniref:Uncharacterized protein n=1 Tax=Tilletia horrida TaxID=155126 RepID=A0AAN6GB11_9BASI|nr:hypothetical protein OC842_004967 [Tilletia horrida]KAK0532128.1 hypothetical protein OC835_003429 [Tilletia horrida]